MTLPVPHTLLVAACLIASVTPAVRAEEEVKASATGNEEAAAADAAVNPGDPGVRLLLPPPASALRADKRLFGVMPNYRATDEPAIYKPLTALEKFKIAERDTFDWPNYFMMAGYALQNQIAEKGWRQTGFGRNFGEYYARTFGDALIGNYFTEAVMPALLHEDPRFFRSGVGPAWKRAYKAARQVVVTRTTDGHERFNYSEVLGNSAVVAATSLYYPGERRMGPGAERVAMAVGNDVISNMLTEFWPDMKRGILPLFHRLHRMD